MSKKNNAPQLRRTMTAGQMEMISLGGAIGVGLFMGSTSTIKWTGPSVLLAYMFVGLILYIVMRALGEMLYINPGTGSFADYATEYVHPLAGYLAEWANVFEYIIVGMSEVVAATEYLKYWWPNISALWSGIIIIAFLLLANLASAKAYASLEFWFAMIKVITIILMIVLGFIVIFFGVGNGGKPTGFSNLWSDGCWRVCRADDLAGCPVFFGGSLHRNSRPYHGRLDRRSSYDGLHVESDKYLRHHRTGYRACAFCDAASS